MLLGFNDEGVKYTSSKDGIVKTNDLAMIHNDFYLVNTNKSKGESLMERDWSDLSTTWLLKKNQESLSMDHVTFTTKLKQIMHMNKIIL